jgi:hypothetical protein
MNPDGSVNPAAIGTALAAIKMATGGNKVETGGYNKPIPKFEAVREQVPVLQCHTQAEER